MADYYKHVYAALRAAMIDRDMGDKEEDAVLVDFVSAQTALKPAVPSAALLISYSMLYYQNWLAASDPEVGLNPDSLSIETFLGGTQNYRFPLLYNVNLAMVAVAVGCYAKLWNVEYSHVLQTVMITPNVDSPLVQETTRLIKENPELTYTDARNIFIDLMKQEQYAEGIFLADDYVANASFITEAEASAETTADQIKQMQEKSVDLSGYFKGVH